MQVFILLKVMALEHIGLLLLPPRVRRVLARAERRTSAAAAARARSADRASMCGS